MVGTWLILNCFIVLLCSVIRGINGANSSSNSTCVIDFHVTYKFYLCLDHKYYECSPNHNSTKGNVVNITNSSSNSSSSSSSAFTYISYINGKKLLEKSGCNYISNKCPSTHGIVMLSCNSNFSHVNSTTVGSSNGKNCVVTQTNNVTSKTNQLKCSIIINANSKNYYYAFIAVIVLVIVLFCLCPICCLYHFCRYCQGNEFYKSYHGRKNNKCNNNKKSTMGTTTNKNNTCEASSEDRAVLFSTNMKTTTTTARSEQQIEAQPINKSSMSRDGFCNTNANDEIVV